MQFCYFMMSIQAIIWSRWGIKLLQSTRPLQPLTQILSDPTSQWKSQTLFEKPVTFRLIVSNQWTWWVGRCDMQSRCFDICLTVKIHTLQNAVCPALHERFLPAQWRCHTGTCGKLQPHSPPLEPLENTGGNPSLIKNNTSPSPRLLWSELLWVPTVCDDNESRKEGNDFVSD